MKTLIKMVAVLCLALGTIATNAGLITLNLNNFNSYDELDSESNIILTISLNSQTGNPAGSPIVIDGIGWDLNIETFGASWLSEASIEIGDGLLFLTPGLGVDESGSQLFSSNGIISLSDLGVENITLSQGIMQLQFFETFDDAFLDLDSIFRGTLTFSTVMAPVPVPTAIWLFFSALFSAGLIRRRG